MGGRWGGALGCRGELPPGDRRGVGVSSRRGTAGRQATRRLHVAVSRFPRASGQPRPAPRRDREEASRRAPRGRDDRHCDPVRLTLPRSPATGLSTIQLAPNVLERFQPKGPRLVMQRDAGLRGENTVVPPSAASHDHLVKTRISPRTSEPNKCGSRHHSWVILWKLCRGSF